MLETSARLLALLGLLQTRGSWAGAELAERIDVGERTLRKDIERLRELGYPIDSVRGPAGGYRLGDHGRLPPLLLSDDEAVAVAVGLGVVRAVPGIEETSTLALAKLEQILPDPLRRRVRALHDNTDVGPANTSTNVEPPPVDPVAARGPGRGRPRPRGDPLPLRRRAAAPRGGAASAGQLAAPLVRRGEAPARRRVAGLPGGLDDPPGARRRPVHAEAARRRRLRGVRAARRRVDGVEGACPDRGGRPGGRRTLPDQPDRRCGRDRRRDALRAGHRRRQHRDPGGVGRHARPRLPRHRAAGAGRAPARAGCEIRRCDAGQRGRSGLTRRVFSAVASIW